MSNKAAISFMAPNAKTALRTFAWTKDKTDSRALIYKVAKAIPLPKTVNPICANNRVEDQGQLGACTGHAVTTALEVELGLTSMQLSRLMAYYNARVIEGTISTDSGAMIRDVIKGLLNTGVCNEDLCAYDISKFNVAPSAAAYNNAKTIIAQVLAKKIVYQRVTTLNDVLNAIGTGSPVAFGFYAPASIMKLPLSGILAVPRNNNEFIGGHAVVADGYNQAQSFFWVRNSWGINWGLKGYFKMPFSWFTDSRGLVDD